MNTRTYPNLSKLLKHYENKWVLLSADMKKVVSNGKTLAEARKKYKGSKDKVVAYRVPSFNSYFIPAQT